MTFWRSTRIAVLGLGCLGLSVLVGPGPTEAKDVDLGEHTQHPALYITSTDVNPQTLRRANCTKDGDGAKAPADAERPTTKLVLGDPASTSAPYERPRFLNFIPDVRLDELTSEWTSEPGETPTTPGTYEATIYPCETATPEQAEQAQKLLDQSLEAALRNGWFSKEKALADGFRIQHHGEHVHFVNPAFLNDGEILSPDKPEFLVFFEEDGVPELAGFMYVMEGVNDRGPQIGGPLTVWHYHVMHDMCMKDGLMSGMPDADGNCAEGERTRRSPEMLHAWFWKRKDGPFSSDMSSPRK